MILEKKECAHTLCRHKVPLARRSLTSPRSVPPSIPGTWDSSGNCCLGTFGLLASNCDDEGSGAIGGGRQVRSCVTDPDGSRVELTSLSLVVYDFQPSLGRRPLFCRSPGWLTCSMFCKRGRRWCIDGPQSSILCRALLAADSVIVTAFCRTSVHVLNILKMHPGIVPINKVLLMHDHVMRADSEAELVNVATE